MLSACGEPKAVPMNDEFAGNSGQSADDGGNPSGKYDAGAQQSKSSAQIEDSGDSQDSKTSRISLKPILAITKMANTKSKPRMVLLQKIVLM